jgi:hypothetical chaperone protein
MPTMQIGLDFGTTNSGAALFDGQDVHTLPIDPAASDPSVVRSTLYIPREGEVHIGQQAIDAYYEQNTGRASRLVRRYVGEVEMVFAELPPIVREVYVLVDELTPGRLLHSLKEELAGGFDSTEVFGRRYSLEELVGAFLRQIRERAEEQVGQAIDSVVLGRPVTFAGAEEQADPERANQRAVSRLRGAAEIAGFRHVSFELEPVAAALFYEQQLDHTERIVVFDFGGGTLDVTVMTVGAPGARRIHAIGGVALAGDAFDRQIIGRLMLDHFGRGTTWSADEMRFPPAYTDALIDWRRAVELNSPSTLHFLQQAQINGSHPARVQALQSLLVNNQVLHLTHAAERAKVALSATRFSALHLATEDMNIWQPVTRSQFESLIGRARRQIERCVLDTVARSGLEPNQIDAVIRTGGSAQIPCFARMLERHFGPQKVILTDVFGSVTSGLAIRAHLGADPDSSATL